MVELPLGAMDPRKVAIVTGATRGLGRRVSQGLVEQGFTVAAVARSADPPGIGEELYRAFDTGDADSVDRFVSEVLERFGRVDLLVNNAGFANRSTPIAETADTVVRQCFETNVFGPAAFMKRVLPVMAHQPEGGVVVNVASRAGITPVPGLAGYSASKSALIALTLAAAKEYPGGRVFCVALCPAGMNTAMRVEVYGAEDAARQMDPARSADLVLELATRRTANGAPVASGSAVVLDGAGEPTVLAWPTDSRGHQSVRFS